MLLFLDLSVVFQVKNYIDSSVKPSYPFLIVNLDFQSNLLIHLIQKSFRNFAHSFGRLVP